MIEKFMSNNPSSDNNTHSEKKFATGITAFDKITGGGLPRDSSIALIGKAGCEKTLLARQIVWRVLQRGSRVLYYSVDQSAEELRFDMLSYGWDIKPFEENGQFCLVDIFSSGTNVMVKALRDSFGNGMSDEEHQARSFTNAVSDMSFHQKMYDVNLIYKNGIRFISPLSLLKYPHRLAVFDSLSPLFTTNTPQGVFQLIHVLKFATRAGKATGIGIMHTGVHDSETEEKFKSIADAIVEIKTRDETVDFITIRKYPGKFKTGSFPLEATERGVKIIPMVMPDLF
jgi:KaiC/GvpD/RAD55 family RecA-like ATPase